VETKRPKCEQVEVGKHSEQENRSWLPGNGILDQVAKVLSVGSLHHREVMTALENVSRCRKNG